MTPARRQVSEKDSLSNLQIAIGGCLAIVAYMLATEDGLAHWFIIPVFACGVIIGIDAVEYLRGRLDLFDPVGILGLFGVHFFFLCPLLHVAWDSYLEDYLQHPPDWRPWLGYMAMLNAAGLALYQGARRRAALWGGTKPQVKMRHISRRRFYIACVIGLLISGLLQVSFFISRGGVMAYIESVGANVGASEGEKLDQGMGIVFMISESFPILAMLFYAIVSERRKWARTIGMVLGALLVFFILKMFFGGLRGSRSQIIWALFWAAGIVHCWVRPLSRQFVAFGLCFLVAFMYLYGFYKGLGANALDAFEEGALTEKSKRGMDSMLLGDLGRADVHAFLLHRIMRAESDYKLAWGRTYIGSVCLLIPKSILPNRPPIKTKEGTDAFFGAGTYEAGKWYSSKVYGIAGETMLNFGPYAVPLAYLVFGLIVGRLQHYHRTLDRRDARRLVYPFFVMWCFSIIQSDTDNLIFNFIKDGMMPMAVVYAGSRSMLRPRPKMKSTLPTPMASLPYPATA